MGTQLIYQEENLFVTSKGESELVVMTYYPCYVNPSFSLDYAYINEFTQQKNLKITGLKTGRYQIKTYEYDRTNISVFHIIEKLGSPRFMNAEEIEYLEGSVIPKMNIKEEDISEEYLLKTTLTFNGIYVAKFRRIDSENLESVKYE